MLASPGSGACFLIDVECYFMRNILQEIFFGVPMERHYVQGA